jgi:hypothetical protein
MGRGTRDTWFHDVSSRGFAPGSDFALKFLAAPFSVYGEGDDSSFSKPLVEFVRPVAD